MAKGVVPIPKVETAILAPGYRGLGLDLVTDDAMY
jgi:hypothetical protein